MRKYQILILIELLLLFLCLPACFAKEEFVYKEIFGDANASESEREYFRLSPGVYQVRVTADIPADASVYLGVYAEESSFQAIRCNGMTFREGQKFEDFEVYVVDWVDKAYIERQFANTDFTAIQAVEIYKTNMGGRICCFCILTGSLLVNALLLYRKKVLEGKISRQKQLAFWVLVLSVALSYFPYATDYFNLGEESAFHMLRIEGLKETLVNGGQFPVRVQSYWLCGHGYAVSLFYGDIFLFIPAVLRLIGFPLMDAYKIFVLLVMAATAVTAYYSLKKCTQNDSAALLGSVIYVLAPYRIYNVYNRGAVGEYVAMIFLPLVLCGMYRLFTEAAEDREYAKAKIPLIIGLSGILQSHLPTCCMTVFGIFLVCVVMWKKTLQKRTFFQLAQAAVISLLLNCWFWLPLVQMMGMDTFRFHSLMNENIQEKGALLAGIVQIWPNMGGNQAEMYGREPVQIGIASLVLLGIFWILYFIKKIRKKDGNIQTNPYDKATSFFGACIIIMVILSSNIFPWDFLAKIPGLRFLVAILQSPARMLSFASAFCAMFAAFFLLWMQNERGIHEEVVKGLNCTVLFLAVFSGVYHVNDIAYNILPVRLYNAESIGTMEVVNGGYLLEGAVPEEYKFHAPVAQEGLKYYNYSQNGTNISLSVINDTDENRYLELPLIGYKGYGLDYTNPKLTGNEAAEYPYIVERAEGGFNNHCDLKIAVPAGYSGELEISYKGFASYRAAEMLSVATLLCIGVYAGGRKMKELRR